jgi:hypothetical protein
MWKLLKIIIASSLLFYLTNNIFAQNPMNQTFEITSEHIRQSWYGDTQVNKQTPFLVAQNERQWQQLWQTVNPNATTPTWHQGDTGIFIFLGEQLPGNTYAQLTTLEQDKNPGTLYGQKMRDLSAMSMAAFQDIWVVFSLKENATLPINRINQVTSVL